MFILPKISGEDLRKLHAEVNQYINHKMVILTIAVTITGVMIGFMINIVGSISKQDNTTFNLLNQNLIKISKDLDVAITESGKIIGDLNGVIKFIGNNTGKQTVKNQVNKLKTIVTDLGNIRQYLIAIVRTVFATN